MVKGESTIEIALRDTTDIPITAAALLGEAEVFITGDKELQSTTKMEKLEIVSPRQFWERLKAQPDAAGRRESQ